MPVFEYTALNARGKSVSGIVDAESATAARQKLRTSRIFPVAIKETQRQSPAAKTKRPLISFKILQRIRPIEITLMTRQLASLVGAGFPLVPAIETLIPTTKSQAFKKVLAQVKDSIVEGSSFSYALAQYPNIFSKHYTNMVSAGETSGTLEIILERLADILEKQQALQNRIRTALAYPIFMGIIGMLVLFVLMAYIVPSITSIFVEMNQSLPAPTRFLISFSEFLKFYWWILLIGAGGLLIALRTFRRTRRGRYWVDRAMLQLPLVGPLKRKLAVSRFARTLGSLHENGVSMLISMEIVKNVVGNVLISKAVEEAAKEVGKGHGLGAALASSEIFPQLSIQMIQVGEQSGELEAMLTKVADVFDNEIESSVMRLTSLLEPVMILLTGSVVGFIVISICLPIFEMNQLIK